MRYIDFSLIDPNDPDVQKWVIKARGKLSEISSLTTHKARTAYLKKNGIWSEFKQILIRYYGAKCWYSEYDIGDSFGDVDHFRPKNRSVDETEKEILKDGYWWLAYDFYNYRLSCEKCNRRYGNGGKQDCFPIKPGTTPATPPNKDDTPLLLDPCELRDVQMIDCDETGEIVSLSADDYEKKRVSISKKVYNWNCFNSARKEVRNKCKTTLEIFECFYESMPEKLELPLTQIANLTNEQTPFSSFAKKYIKNWIEGKSYATVLAAVL